jgi:tRNA A-37 threonylcarbamoyl transferase component Bud32
VKADSQIETVRKDAREPETAEFQTVAADETLILGRYKLGRRLGAGGFATVYAAHDERLDRPVAIKVLPRERVIHSRFEREARAAARLHHPSIVTLFEAAVDDEGAYLVSELVKGTTLDRALELGELSDRDILEIAIALGDALDHAHANEVVHRDVKPQNVLVPARKAKRTGANALAPAKLTDFGVARVVGGDTLTRAGDVIGTLGYMSPEQAEGRESGPPADLYSLALLTYEALTGINPVADQIRQGRHRRLGAFLPPIRRQRADLPRHLGAAIDQALRPRPSERGSILDLCLALTDAVALVDDAAGVVAPAKAIAITRRPEDDRATERPGRAWSENPGTRSAPAVEPTAHSRTGTLELAPGGLLLLATGLLAVPLGFIGLAGVWPALLTQTIRGFWRRGVAAAAGFAALGLAGQLAPRNFYYHLDTNSLTTLQPAAIGLGIWAAAAGLSPLLVRNARPRLDLVLVSLVAAAVPVGLTLGGLHHVAGLVPGALIGWLIAAHRPLIGVIRDTIASRALP